MRQWCMAALLALAACGSGDDDAADASLPDVGDLPDVMQPPPDVADVDAVARTITGTSQVVHVLEGGEMVVPDDLSVTPVAAWVETPSGDFAGHVGSGAADGTFTIPGVEEGPYILGLGTWLRSLTASTYLREQVQLGRPGTVLAGSTTPVTISLTGLSPWQSLDSLQLLSTNAGAMEFNLENAATVFPSGGETALTLNIDWRALGAPLIDAAEGDELSILQLSERIGSGFNYSALARIGTATPVTLTEGAAATIDMTMVSVPGTLTADIDWRRTQFAAYATDAHPDAVFYWDVFAIDALPQAATRGFYDSAPDLVYIQAEFGVPPTDLAGTVTYGNPFGPTWTQFALAHVWLSVDITAPGASLPITAYGWMAAHVDMPSLAAGPIVPVVTPPRNLAIEGAPPGGGPLPSATPTLTWQAPTVGSAPSYRVYALRLGEIGGGTTITVEPWTLYVDDTRVTIPPALLQPGAAYVFRVTAYVGSGDFPSGSASSLSAVFTP